jgi:hypothetical protein
LFLQEQIKDIIITWKRGGDCKAEVAPGVSLDGVRRSEKAEVPEKTSGEVTELSSNKQHFFFVFPTGFTCAAEVAPPSRKS